MSEFRELLNETETVEARMTTFTSKILAEIGNISGLNRINSWYIADGVVGLFHYDHDGNAYEIKISPVSQGQYKELWGDQIKKREDRVE